MTRQFDICATLFFGLIKDHPFIDANKRTAFLSCVFQLQRNEYVPNVPEKQFEDFAVEVAENQLSNYKRFRDLALRESDPEVRFISYWLRQNTRQVDKSHHAITYRDLERILRRFGFGMENLSDNQIDIVKYRKRRKYGILGPMVEDRQRVCRIGCRGATKEVDRQLVRYVREETGLTEKKGYDSKVFFDGLDPLSVLLSRYETPLRSLAFR